MTRNRTGSLTAATWLIGLGIVFLVQRAADLPWSQAWPMFLILIGVASFVTTILHGRYVYGGLWAFTWPVAWIVVGSLLLASTTGRIGTEPGQLIADYWPWALVILGVWFVIGAFVPSGRGLTETLQLPLGGASEARVRIGYGAGNLAVGSAAPGQLVDGRFEGGVIHRTTGTGAVELTQDRGHGMTWLERPSRWTMGLTTEVPLDLRVDTGASKATLDLGGLRLRQPGPPHRRKRDAGPAAAGGRCDDGHRPDRRGLAHDRGPGRSGGADPDEDGAGEQPDRPGPVPGEWQRL